MSMFFLFSICEFLSRFIHTHTDTHTHTHTHIYTYALIDTPIQGFSGGTTGKEPAC